MKLPATVEVRPDVSLGSLPLESVRADMLRRIGEASLTPEQRRRALTELDFHLEYERLRRVRSAVWQWQDERRERGYRLEVRHEEHITRLVLQRRRARAEAAEIDARVINTRLDIIERVRKLKPRDDSRAFLDRGHRELMRQEMNRRLSRRARRHMQEELSEMVFARARFLQEVRQDFPDLEEELMDTYDQRLYQQGIRSER